MRPAICPQKILQLVVHASYLERAWLTRINCPAAWRLIGITIGTLKKFVPIIIAPTFRYSWFKHKYWKDPYVTECTGTFEICCFISGVLLQRAGLAGTSGWSIPAGEQNIKVSMNSWKCPNISLALSMALTSQPMSTLLCGCQATLLVLQISVSVFCSPQQGIGTQHWAVCFQLFKCLLKCVFFPPL